MAHPQQFEFCLSVKQAFPHFFHNTLVLDVGSLDINGNNQLLFDDCLYLGIDLAPGRNVDISTPAHALQLPDASVDAIVSTECFEHDRFYARTLQNIVRMVKPGGLFFFSCATTGRPEHGTRRTTPADAPFLQTLGDWSDYYKNLEEADIREAINVDATFAQYAFSIGRETSDLYFWGIRRGVFHKRSDYSFLVRAHGVLSDLKAQAKRLSEVQAELHERDERELRLHLSLDGYRVTVQSLQQALAAQEARIARLDHAQACQEAERIQLQEAATQALKQGQLQGQQEAQRQAQGQIEQLQHTVATQQARHTQLVDSKSWRLTRPLRFMARLLRGEVQTALSSPAVQSYPTRLRARLRLVYHRLPLSNRMKLRLRQRLHPLTAALDQSPSLSSLSRAAIDVISGSPAHSPLTRDPARERALARILCDLASAAQTHGPATNWLALPFLSTGGAERVALHFAKALREIHPDQSVVLLVTDRPAVDPGMEIPQGVTLVVLDSYLAEDHSYVCKQALLRDLLVALRPRCFHLINSEVAWNLVLAEGARLKGLVTLYASIFAFQFAPDGKTPTGYAAYFLKKGMPHLAGLVSDNQRFIRDAIAHYQLDESAQQRMWAVYQPCRWQPEPAGQLGDADPAPRAQAAPALARPQLLWAGRLDAEKRVDLFLDIVRHCAFADFHVFGHQVLGNDAALPQLPNLHVKGPFRSPQEWTAHQSYDAFVFTSHWEGLPNVVVEAGALGIPVIAPTVGGVGELVSDDTGYPLPERPSVADYETALRAVQNHPDAARQRGRRLRQKVQTQHSWAGFVDAVGALPHYLSALPPGDAKLSVVQPPATPTVSVVIPCYNQGAYLHECVSSALLAFHGPLEIIVVDDGSTDAHTGRHLDEVRQLAPDTIRIHRQANQGLSGARNAGVALARGAYLQFLDADDLLVPNKIDTQLAQLQANPQLDVSICNFLLCDEARNLYSKPEEAIARFDLTLEDFLYRWERGFAVPIHCGLFRRRVLSDTPFDTQARAKEDWLFWTQLAIAQAQFGYVHGHWAIYRQHEHSMRRSYLAMGRAWLQAGLEINTLLAGRAPLFFESLVAWFEQCYRAHPAYRSEIASLQKADASAPVPALSQAPQTTPEPTAAAAPAAVAVAERVLARLAQTIRCPQAPLFSVIVPIYGHYAYLEECLLSVADQGDVSLEIICLDDGSPDPRIGQLMAALQGRNDRLKTLVHTDNRGIGVTQNTAVAHASGHYLAFLDCDDALVPGALATARDSIAAHPEVDYFFSDRLDVDAHQQVLRTARYGGYPQLRFSSQEAIRSDLLDGMVASHLKVIRRAAYLDVGGCQPHLSGVQDWDLALRIAEGGRLHYINQALYRHRVHSHSVTQSDSVAQFRKTNQVRRHYCERWLRSAPDASSPSTPPAPCQRIGLSELPLPLSTLKAYWQQGRRCVLDAKGIPSVGQLNWLREFNSYFEAIAWDHPEVPAALLGYLWSPQPMEPEGPHTRP